MESRQLVTLFVTVQAATVFTQFLPRLSELAERPESDTKGRVPATWAAVGMACVIGAVASGIVGSPGPLIASAATAFGLMVTYELVART